MDHDDPMRDDLFDWTETSREKEPLRILAESDMGILARWERLRLLYNLILAAEVLLLTAKPGSLPVWDRRSLIVLSVYGLGLALHGLAANVCFCAGPIAEYYILKLGLPQAYVTATLVACGTVLSAYLAATAMFRPSLF